MGNLQKEIDFFHFISPKLLELVSSYGRDIAIAKIKGGSDYATEVDVAVEQIIVAEIKKRFPEDHIMAEEEHSDTVIREGRIWIIDPICGTSNLARGIKNFCTNIALADKGKLVAACVVDHSQNDYVWSIGDGKIYVNNSLFHEPSEKPEIAVDVDFGALYAVDEKVKDEHGRAVSRLVKDSSYVLLSLNTSLSFFYVAIGKIDGFINVFNYPWDICAASFLIQQSGGIITDLSGKPWSISTKGAIGSKNKAIHQKLLDAYTQG
jgi:myo-inositol-1(or 4)-monophosphatase